MLTFFLLLFFFFLKLEEVPIEGILVLFSFLYLLALEGVAPSCLSACGTQTDTRDPPASEEVTGFDLQGLRTASHRRPSRSSVLQADRAGGVLPPNESSSNVPISWQERGGDRRYAKAPLC